MDKVKKDFIKIIKGIDKAERGGELSEMAKSTRNRAKKVLVLIDKEVSEKYLTRVITAFYNRF